MQCIFNAADGLSHAWTRYVAKVIFTYILGYKVDVGHMEAVNLISSHKYSEKQIVSYYLAVSWSSIMDVFFVGVPCRHIAHA